MTDDDFELPNSLSLTKATAGVPYVRDPMGFIDGDWGCMDCNGELMGPEQARLCGIRCFASSPGLFIQYSIVR